MSEPGRPLGAAIVGAGIGASHLDGYLALPDRFAVRAVCDLDEVRAAALAARAPGAAVETDYAALLARPDIDVVSVCTPPMLHKPMTLEAIAAGKHVVCEKPLAGSLADVDEIAVAALGAGVVVVPVYQYRFGAGIRKLRALVAAGLTGAPFVATVETHWNRGPRYYDVPWRGKRATELGGALLSHAIHAHDLLTLVLGPARRVAGFTATRVNPIETEDCAAVAVEFDGGALATLSVTLGAAKDTSRMRFCFANLTAESSLAPYDPGAAPPVTLADARESLALAFAIYDAAGTGTVVEM